MRLAIVPSVVCVVLLALARPSLAQSPSNEQSPLQTFNASANADQPDYFGKKSVPQKVSFRQAKPRTRRQHIIIASLFGGALAFGGIGLYFHLDSRDASNTLSIAGGEPIRTYDRAADSLRDRAFRSRTLAIVGYSIGGAFIAATIAAMSMTQPGDEIISIDDEPAPKNTVPVSVVPVRGGAVVGKAWSF